MHQEIKISGSGPHSTAAGLSSNKSIALRDVQMGFHLNVCA